MSQLRRLSKHTSLSLLRRAELPVATVLDVGVMRWTPELRSVFHDRKHLLFEPVMEFYPHIHENYRGCDYDLIEAAVSSSPGEAKLRTFDLDGGNTGVSHSRLEPAGNRTVRTVTLDNFLENNQHETPYLLKIDVDGNEMDVLKGAKYTLNNCSCVVIEMPLVTLPERAAYLSEADFILWDIVDFGYYKHALRWVDFVFVHRKYRETLPELDPVTSGPINPALWVSLDNYTG